MLPWRAEKNTLTVARSPPDSQFVGGFFPHGVGICGVVVENEVEQSNMRTSENNSDHHLKQSQGSIYGGGMSRAV
jgi:hypothetical protein